MMKAKGRKAVVLMIVIITLLLPNLAVSARADQSGISAGVVSTSWGALNVRSSPDTGAPLITKLPKGTYVTLIEKTGSWWKVEYADSCYGYVSVQYISAISGTYARKVTASLLNVRSGAGTAYSVKEVLPGGKTVVVLSTDSGWSRILYNGTRTGYVSSKYLGGAMVWPVPASAKINQYFKAGSHLGIDIGAVTRGAAGDAVVAAQSGKVVYSGWLNGYGYVVYINSTLNGTPIQTRYAHLHSASYLKAGDTVNAGQWIAAMGNSGTSSGVHLHFEVRIRKSSADCIANADSTPVNPFDYVS